MINKHLLELRNKRRPGACLVGSAPGANTNLAGKESVTAGPVGQESEGGYVIGAAVLYFSKCKAYSPARVLAARAPRGMGNNSARIRPKEPRCGTGDRFRHATGRSPPVA